MSVISQKLLEKEYLENKHSAAEIADSLDCSENKVNYWLRKYKIPKRTVSEAIYVKNNPDGDPFSQKQLHKKEQFFLYGLGLGLYWGEGTKSNQHTVRLGNTDPRLVKKFLEFLVECFEIDERKLHFGLQIFSDMNPRKAKAFWIKKLGVSGSQFQKVIVTPARSVGTYRNKTEHGVLTVHFNNKKLRDIIIDEIEKL